MNNNINLDISIHAAREGGDRHGSSTTAIGCISIHAAREGGDTYAFALGAHPYSISIHAAREGGDFKRKDGSIERVYFNPRRP